MKRRNFRGAVGFADLLTALALSALVVGLVINWVTKLPKSDDLTIRGDGWSRDITTWDFIEVDHPLDSEHTIKPARYFVQVDGDEERVILEPVRPSSDLTMEKISIARFVREMSGGTSPLAVHHPGSPEHTKLKDEFDEARGFADLSNSK